MVKGEGAKKKRGRPYPPRTNEADREEMRRLRREGWKVREIAERFGLSRGYTQKIVALAWVDDEELSA